MSKTGRKSRRRLFAGLGLAAALAAVLLMGGMCLRAEVRPGAFEKGSASKEADKEAGIAKDKTPLTQELRHLIQTTTPREEYLGLVHLELLTAAENTTGALAQSAQNVLPTVVQIQTGEFLGSGIILKIGEEALLIASNRHQLQSRETSSIKLYSGEVVYGRRFYLSEACDLGFVEAEIGGLSYEQRKKLRSVLISQSCQQQLASGDAMFVVGSADGVACNIYEGTVADPWYYFDEFGSYMIYNHCRAKAGMSGGGTYDAHGHCIGMVTGGYEEETASLPIQTICQELAKALEDAPKWKAEP